VCVRACVCVYMCVPFFHAVVRTWHSVHNVCKILSLRVSQQPFCLPGIQRENLKIAFLLVWHTNVNL